MKKILSLLISCVCMMNLSGCELLHNEGAEDATQWKEQTNSNNIEEIESVTEGNENLAETETESVAETENLIKQEVAIRIHPDGKNLETRITVPEGYTRVEAENGSFLSYLREYPLKEDGSPVLLFDGREKGNQNAHVAVFDLSLADENLQQCADSVMRMYAEYFYQTNQQERIVFRFVNGFRAEYVKWRDGYRIDVNGNEVSWVLTEEYDDSYECFMQYLRMVYAYCGTLSMEQESEEIEVSQVQVGDVLLRGGSPGHVVMVVDVCEDGTGKKAFLLAQGYMPAQEFHLLKNPLHGEDPWYYETEFSYPLLTPEYTFFEGSLRRLVY